MNDSTIQAKIPSTFSSLPPELHNQIISDLDFSSAFHLSRTNRYFYRTVDATNKPIPWGFPLKRESMHRCRQFRNHFVCYGCDCIKPKEAFVKKQVTGRRGHMGRDHRKRSCFDCSVRRGAFPINQQVVKLDGSSYVSVANPLGGKMMMRFMDEED